MSALGARRAWLRRNSRILSKPLWVMMGLAVVSTLGAVQASRVVCGMCEEQDRFVRLQVSTRDRPAESAQSFSHPVQLSVEQWRPILRSIQVQKRGQGLPFLPAPNGPALPAFTPTEVEYLCETLPRAFAQAQPSEVVVFGLTTHKSQGIGEITTGAWFVKDSTLYLILGNYREGFTMPNIRELLWQDPLYMIAAPLYEFVPGPYQSLTREGNQLWTFLLPEAPQLALTYQQLSLSVPPTDGGHDMGPDPPVRSGTSLEGKLQQLKQIRDKGMITDDEYAAKRKSLLDGF